MYKQNIKTDELTNDALCVCEDTSISASERAAINRVIEMYENGDLREDDFISFEEFQHRMRRRF